MPRTAPTVENTLASKVRAAWPRTRTTWIGIIFTALTTAMSIVSLQDDLAYSLERVGWQCGLLLLVLVLTFTARRKFLPNPNVRQIVSGTLLWLVGVAAVSASLWLANDRASTEETAKIFTEASGTVDFSDKVGTLARFDDQYLGHSNFQDAELTGGGFAGANLSESDFRGAVFVDVDFSGANLCAVDARGADLSRAVNLADVSNWNYFVYDETTVFPDGFTPAMLDGLVKIGQQSRTSFVFTCDGVENRVMKLDART